MDKFPKLASKINIQLLMKRWVENSDAETRDHTSLLEVGRFRCGSEGCGSSPVSRLKHEQAGSLFVCLH